MASNPGFTSEAPATLTGGEALARQLAAAGVQHVFGVPGVQLDWAVDGLASLEGAIQYMVPRHEQATSYMADGYARSTGRVGVAMVVPGPGVLNAMAGLATAYACCSKVLMVAGQIHLPFIGKNLGMLHEVREQSRILESVTKWRALADKPAAVAGLVRDALGSLHTGTPRPAALEIPPDVLRARTANDVRTFAPPAPVAPEAALIKSAAALLRRAKFPVIVAGGGVLAAGAFAELARLAERLQAPVAITEDGLGSLPTHHPLAVSPLGTRAVLPHADCVLGVGTRFVDSRGLPLVDSARADVILLNADPGDLGLPRQPTLGLMGDARAGLAALVAELDGLPARASRAADMERVRAWCQEQIAPMEPQGSWLRALRAAIPEDGILINELTQVGYVGTIAYPIRAPRTFLTPGYQGTLGYGWATALGAAVGNPDKPVVAISGDGGFGWNLQELATAKRYGLRAVAVVFNDSAFGNVKRMQIGQFGRVLGSDLVNPDFVKLAQAFGIDAERVSEPAALQAALASAIAARRPGLIEVTVGAMPNPWHLLRSHYQAATPPPPNPLGEVPAA